MGKALQQLQSNIASALPTVGGLAHSTWRAYANEWVMHDAPLNFIDGDLVSQFLDLDMDRMAKLVSGEVGQPIDVSIQDIVGALEELSSAY